MEILENKREQRYTMRWLGFQSLFIIIVALVLAAIVGIVDTCASGRRDSGLLTEDSYSLVTSSTSYCFLVIAITLFSLMLIEVAFRRSINYLQYALIACSLTVFHLLLLAMSEHMPFWLAYIIVSLMTIGLILWFVYQLMRERKAVILTGSILTAEYAIMVILLYMGSMALLVGSLSLFALIAVAMYFTLKLKVENEELVLK